MQGTSLPIKQNKTVCSTRPKKTNQSMKFPPIKQNKTNPFRQHVCMSIQLIFFCTNTCSFPLNKTKRIFSCRSSLHKHILIPARKAKECCFFRLFPRKVFHVYSKIQHTLCFFHCCVCSFVWSWDILPFKLVPLPPFPLFCAVSLGFCSKVRTTCSQESCSF